MGAYGNAKKRKFHANMAAVYFNNKNTIPLVKSKKYATFAA